MSNRWCPPPCPPPPPPPCPPTCAPPPPKPPCSTKPIMKGLHWAQTQKLIGQSIVLSIIGAAAYWYFVGQQRKKVYAEFYAKAELEDWADDMARKGLFDSVPKGDLKDNQHAK